MALALLGAMLGFAPFNRPVAQLFLGDVGSLPIGLLLGWLLVLLAGRGHLAAALLLPLYYLADATITLLRRLANRRAVLAGAPQPFLSARDRLAAYTVPEVVARVFAVNVALVALAGGNGLVALRVRRSLAALVTGCRAGRLAALQFRARQATEHYAASPRKSGTASRSTR